MEERGRAREGAGDGGRARSVTPPSARWQQRQGRRRPTAGRGGEGRGGTGAETPSAPGEAAVTCPGRPQGLGALLAGCAWCYGMTPAPLPPPPASPGLVLLVMAQPWSQWLLLLPGDAEMQMETTVPSMPRPGGGG